MKRRMGRGLKYKSDYRESRCVYGALGQGLSNKSDLGCQ